MARKSLASSLPINDHTIDKIKTAIADMLETHAEEIGKFVEESDDRTAVVTFGVTLDCSESAPDIDVKCRFSQSVTDRRSIKCDDPNQPNLFTIKTPKEIDKEAQAAAKEEEKAAKKAEKAAKKAEKEANAAE